jgi:eukaryotic-like serine/threonine-protein kinase
MNTARAQSATNLSRSSPVASLAPRDPAPDSLCGRLLQNRYLPGALLSAGPFGARYLARDLSLNETVCLELLPRRALATWGESRAQLAKLAELGDPNIARLLGDGLVGGAWPYLVLERNTARTLESELAGSGPFELARVARIGAQCARGLAAAHGVGVLHGALAPHRVSLGARTGLEQARIAGFGLAPLLQASAETLLDSPPELYCYVSPEHARGETLDARSDIYSLGASLYALAAGKPPFEGSAAAVLRQHLRAIPEAPSRQRGSLQLAFRAFDKIIGRCLAKRRDQRYAGAAELALDLERLHAALARLQPAASAGATLRPASAERGAAPHPGPRAAAAPLHRTLQHCSARQLPKARGRLPVLPKVIVQGG